MLIQIHMIQNYAPSNLNRDDTGSPKDTVFGSVPRGRISSQCLKRSIRKSVVFEEAFRSDGLLGERTKTLPVLLRKNLTEQKADDETINAILSRLPEIIRGSTKGEKSEEEGETEDESESTETKVVSDESTGEIKQLVFLDVKTELNAFASKLLEAYIAAGGSPKKWAALKIKELMKKLDESIPRSVDIAMFGRMTTSPAFKNVQAAVQVAHALSTNALKQDFDYYTAMDDLKPDSEPGADMIGDIEFNSCTYYKYLNVHWEELVKNLGDDAEAKTIACRAVLALLEAAAMTHPTGKQNSFGAFNPPDFILVEVSGRNLPINYANAFLKPVKGYGNQTLLANSVEQFSEYVGRLSKAYNLTPNRAYLTIQDLAFLDLKAQPSIDDLKSWLDKQISQA
jgi:CRISPR system Cascade subunit CasC